MEVIPFPARPKLAKPTQKRKAAEGRSAPLLSMHNTTERLAQAYWALQQMRRHPQSSHNPRH